MLPTTNTSSDDKHHLSYTSTLSQPWTIGHGTVNLPTLAAEAVWHLMMACRSLGAGGWLFLSAGIARTDTRICDVYCWVRRDCPSIRHDRCWDSSHNTHNRCSTHNCSPQLPFIVPVRTKMHRNSWTDIADIVQGQMVQDVCLVLAGCKMRAHTRFAKAAACQAPKHRVFE